MSAEHHCVSGLCHVLSFKDLIASADIAMNAIMGGLDGSGFGDDAASPPLLTLACGSYSAAAGRSDGYKQGSAFFVMTPFRHNVFSRVFSDG